MSNGPAITSSTIPINDEHACNPNPHQLEYGEQCTVYEFELMRNWSLNEKDRKVKIIQFAEEHGFRLRFYRLGWCAHLRPGALKVAAARFCDCLYSVDALAASQCSARCHRLILDAFTNVGLPSCRFLTDTSLYGDRNR